MFGQFRDGTRPFRPRTSLIVRHFLRRPFGCQAPLDHDALTGTRDANDEGCAQPSAWSGRGNSKTIWLRPENPGQESIAVGHLSGALFAGGDPRFMFARWCDIEVAEPGRFVRFLQSIADQGQDNPFAFLQQPQLSRIDLGQVKRRAQRKTLTLQSSLRV